MITTERLILRRWGPQDLTPFAALNADPEVMEHFPSTLTLQETRAGLAQDDAAFERDGFGKWCVVRRGDGVFLGRCGLSPVTPDLPCFPAVELGYRFARHAWGHGYAAEASRAALAYGFGELGLEEIVAFTAVPNTRSRAVMQRIGMTHVPERDFDHPALPEGHRLRRHVLYAILPGGGPQSGYAPQTP